MASEERWKLKAFSLIQVCTKQHMYWQKRFDRKEVDKEIDEEDSSNQKDSQRIMAGVEWLENYKIKATVNKKKVQRIMRSLVYRLLLSFEKAVRNTVRTKAKVGTVCSLIA